MEGSCATATFSGMAGLWKVSEIMERCVVAYCLSFQLAWVVPFSPRLLKLQNHFPSKHFLKQYAQNCEIMQMTVISNL